MDGDINSEIVLADDLMCKALTVNNGIFYTMNHDITCTMEWACFVPTIYFGTSTLTSMGGMDWMDAANLYADSATFIGPMLNVDWGITGLHFGTVETATISAEGTSFNVVHSSSITGMGNTIDLFASDTVISDFAMSQLGPNIFHKVIVSRNAWLGGNTIIDTLIFNDPGDHLQILDADTLTITGEIIMTNTPSNRGKIDGNGSLNKASGIVCVDFVNFDSVQAIGGAQFFAGTNSLMFGGMSTGWQLTGCVTAGGVWPGDANYDLTVNNLDILAIGLASDATGPIRGGASLSWVEQPATDWTNSFVTGVNMKHADCDGNGIVDASDTTAVALNYGMYHPASRIIQPNHIPTSSGILSIDVSPDTVGPSAQVHVNIDLTLDSLYGIAFSVYYDQQLVDGNSLMPDFSNTWLGTNGVNMIGFAKVDQAAGRIDFALTRTDHTDAFGGTGTLMTFDLFTQPTIPVASALTMETNNVNGVYLAENYEVITGSSDSTFVDSTVSVNNMNSAPMNLHSAFTNDQLYVQFFASGPFESKLVVYDNSGRSIYMQDLVAINGINSYTIPLPNIAEGIFVVRLMNEKINCVQKVIHHQVK